MKTTTKNFTEKDTNKIAIDLLVKERANGRGYLQGVYLVKPQGIRNEISICNMIVSGDDVYIYTDSYRVKKSVKSIQKYIRIEY